MTSTATRLCQILEGHLGCDPVAPEHLTDPDLLGELKADSLDMIDLVMTCEDEFDVLISDDEADVFLPDHLGTTRPLSELVVLIDGKIMARAA